MWFRVARLLPAAVIAMVFLAQSGLAAAAPPANDLFADAEVLAGDSGSVPGDNTDATDEPGEPLHAGEATRNSIWYTWTAGGSGTVNFDTFDSVIDTVLAVYQGSSVNTLTEVASNNDFGSWPQSSVTFSAVNGEVYYIAVAGLLDETGKSTLNWRFCDVPVGAPVNPAPLDGETTTARVVELGWDDVPGARDYELFLDGVSFGRVRDNLLDLRAADIPVGPHTWRVVAYDDGCTSTPGDLWKYDDSCSAVLDDPANPVPASGAVLTTVTVLGWDDVAGAVSYEVDLDGDPYTMTVVSSVTVGALAPGLHSWRVTAHSACGTTSSREWEFRLCALAGIPAAPSPVEGETTVCALSLLDWNDAADALSYDVYVDGERLGNTLSSDFSLTEPLTGGAHQWQVVAVGECEGTTGPLWGFCLLGTPAEPVAPGDGTVLSTFPAILEWEPVCGATTYTVYLNGDQIGLTTETRVSVSPVLAATGAHTWYVVAEGECPAGNAGPVWGFTVECPEPEAPAGESPAIGETVGCDLKDLDWDDAAGATGYRVFLNGGEVGLTTSSRWELTVPLASGLHEWRIVSVNECGETTGGRQLFCLLDAPVLLSPAADSTTDCESVRFDWSDACGAASYELYLNGQFTTSTTVSDWPVTGSLTPGNHGWRVKAIGQECGEAWSDLGEFCVQGTPKQSVPFDGETTACAFQLFEWEDTCGAITTATYELLIDGTTVSAGLTESRYSLTTPLAPGAHTWQVMATGECGETFSEVWSFCLLDTPSAPVVPLDGEVRSTFPATLEWEPVCGATTYTVFLNNDQIAITTETRTAAASTLAAPGNHSWHVLAEGECAVVPEGPVWTFTVNCTEPEAAIAPVPESGETVGCDLKALDWDDAEGATSYLVLIDGLEVAVTSSSEHLLPESLGAGSHEWQIVTVGPCGETTGPLWTFCVLDAPVEIAPATGETTDCAAVRFDWSDTCGASSYELFIDGQLEATVSASDYILTASLTPGTHTWVVKAYGQECGETFSESVTFCVQGTPSQPSPAAGETTACALSLLDWDDTCGASSYDVYLDSVFMGSVTDSEYPVSAPLASGPHAWHVIANGCGATSTTLWNFCLLDPPSNPIPAHNDVVLSPVDTFNWSDACGATTYTLVVDGVVTGVTTISQYTLPDGPVADGPHTWQVISENDCSVSAGPLWEFYQGCGAVPAPSGPTPADGSTTDTSISQLRWVATPDILFYRVYIGGQLVATTTSPVLNVSLGYGFYMWQVIAITRDCGQISGPEWTFRVCNIPGMSTLVTPADGVTTNPESILFSWTSVANAGVYTVLVDGNPLATVFETEYRFPFALTSGAHTWSVVAQSGCESTTSPVFNFCTLRTPSNPSPPDTSTFCVPPEALDWADVESATGYDVYFDEQLVSANQAQSRYVLPSSLSEGDYIWRVVVRNECGELSSPEWRIKIVGEAGARRNMWMTNGAVYAMAVSGNIVYLGGNFNRVGPADSNMTVERRNLAAIDVTTGEATDWNPGTDAPVRSLASDGGVLYVGGEFDRVAGQLRSQVAAVDLVNGALLGWNPGANGTVLALAVDGTKVYAGGQFTSFGGTFRRYAAAADKVSGALAGWNPSPNSFVRALASVGSSVYIGGNFSMVGGQSRTGLGAVDATAGGLLPWSPGADHYVYTIVPDGAQVYVGGLFTSIGGASRRNLACIDLTTGLALPWAPQTNGAVNAIALSGNSVFVGGLFSTIAGKSRPYLSVVGVTSGITPDCGYDPDYPIHCLAVSGDTVCVGGDFTYIGTASKRGFAGFGGIDGPGSSVAGWELY